MVSQTLEYALRAMSHLAALGDAGATSEAIADATRVPHHYLSKVMRDLVCAHLVQSFRGRNGGFVLARPAAEISILDIVNAVDPIPRIDRCPLNNPAHVQLCPLHRCLDDALAHIEASFKRATLVSVLKDANQNTCCRSRPGGSCDPPPRTHPHPPPT